MKEKKRNRRKCLGVTRKVSTKWTATLSEGRGVVLPRFATKETMLTCLLETNFNAREDQDGDGTSPFGPDESHSPVSLVTGGEDSG
jgi:hypothetical protein